MNRAVPIAAALAAVGATAVVGLTVKASHPHAIGSPAAVFGQRTPLTAPPTKCMTVPAKMWAGTWHYSTLILKPTRIERYCVSYPPAGGTRVNVTAGPVKP